MENKKYEKVYIKNRFVNILITISFEDFNSDNILIDEKSHKNILIYDISYKPLTEAKSFRIRFDKIDEFRQMEIDI